MSTSAEWTILEKLLLTQAVYKYGENMWFQVARVLKQHGLIQPQQRQSDFFSQKNCQFQYYLLVENLEAEKQLYKNNNLMNDMPVVVRIARQLYLQRIEEVKHALKNDEEEFEQLAREIESIKKGDWDEKLKAQGNLVAEGDQSVEDQDIPATNTTEDKYVQTKADNIPAVQHENGMKRMLSESMLMAANSIKRVRLDDSQDTNEDQVMSTAIAEVISTSNKEESSSPEPFIPTKTVIVNESVISTPVADTANPIMIENVNQLKDVVAQEPVATTSTVAPVTEVIDTIPTRKDDQSGRNLNSSNTLKENSAYIIESNDSQEPVILQQQEEKDNISIIPIPQPLLQQQEQYKQEQHYSQDSFLPTEIITTIHEPTLRQSQSAAFNMTDDEDFNRETAATPTSICTEKKRLSNSDQKQKAWQKNIYLLWQEIANHKNGTMFMNPIKKTHAPLYEQVVKQPLYLRTIKNRVRDGIVKTTTDFERDIILMLTNSLMYNKEGTEMYLMALEMLDDVREQIRLFKSANGFFWESEA